jgi:tRNA(Ile)-lysidine synthase
MTDCRPMAASTTPPSIESGGGPPWVVAVAYSGGRDSTALLHATARLAAAGEWGPDAQVLGLHVHHGLSPLADAWWEHTQAQCANWRLEGLPVAWEGRRIKGQPARAESIEAWARQARYQALAEMAEHVGVDVVLLAHHRQDQAETFLLQALRGAGVAGLASMPVSFERAGIHWLRPWLSRSRAEVQAYVDAHGLSHIDDDSNADPRFARNRLRLKWLPALAIDFQDAEASLAQAANHAADAQACLQAWLSSCLEGLTQVGTGHAGSLSLLAWQALAPAQQRLVLMAWVKRVSDQTLTHGMVLQLQTEWVAPRRSGLRWPLPSGGELRLHQGWIHFAPLTLPTKVREASSVARPGGIACAGRVWPCGIRRAGRHVLPDGLGVVQVRRVTHGGIALAILSQAVWRDRTGGEQFQSGPGRPARSLKKQFQQAGVAAWARSAPLLCLDDQLLFVPGLGVDARAMALPGVPRVELTWLDA